MRKFSLPQNKPLELEDVIRDILNENICRDMRDNWQDLGELKQAMKLHDPSFKVFSVEMNYWEKFDKCIENFDSLIASVPNEVRNRGAPQYFKDYIVLKVDDQDQPESSSAWA